MSELTTAKFKLKSEIKNIDISNAKLINAENVKFKIEENDGEYIIELIDIDKDVDYKNVQIVFDDVDKPFMIGDIYLRADEKEDFTKEISVEERQKRKFSSELKNEREKCSKLLGELADVEKKFENFEKKINKLIFQEKETKSKIDADEKLIVIKEEEISHNKKDLTKIKETNLQTKKENEIEKLQDKLNVLIDKFNKNKNDLYQIEKEISVSKTKLSNLKKDIELIKAKIFGRAFDKINLAAEATRKAWTYDDISALADYDAKKIENFISSLKRKIEEIDENIGYKTKELESITDEKARKKINNNILRLKKELKISKGDLKRYSNKPNKLREKANKLISKFNEYVFEAELSTAIATIANDAVIKIKSDRQKKLVEKIENDQDLTKEKREKLTQEIDKLEIEITKEVKLNESTERPKFIIADNMGIIEKTIKFFFKKTYWNIFERGISSRDDEFLSIFNDFEKQKKELEKNLKQNN